MSTASAQGIKYYAGVYNLAWYSITVLSLCGVFILSAIGNSAGWVLIILGMSALVTLILITSWQTAESGVARPEGGQFTIFFGGIVFFLSVILASEVIPTEIDIPFVGRLVFLVTGIQALFVSVTLRREQITFVRRVVTPVIGHLILSIASLSLILSAFVIPETRVFQGALLWYATGFSVLILNAFWLGQNTTEVTPPPPNSVSGYWEQVLLGSILIGSSCLIFIIFNSLSEPLTFTVASLGQPWEFETTAEQLAVTTVGATTIIGLATLAAPVSAPQFIRQFDRARVTIAFHALTIIVLLNSLIIGLFLFIPVTFLIVFVILIGLVALAVLVDYVRVGYIQQRDKSTVGLASLHESPPITVVIPAYNEAKILSDTIKKEPQCAARSAVSVSSSSGFHGPNRRDLS